MKPTKKTINEKQGSSRKIKSVSGRPQASPKKMNKSSGDLTKQNNERLEKTDKTEKAEKIEKIEKKPRENLRETGTSQSRRTQNTTTATAMPRNFNEYRHLIHGLFSTENDIDWVLKLRADDSMLKEKLEKLKEHNFSFYGKFLEGGDPHKSILDILQDNSEKFRYDHLIRKRLGPTPGVAQVNFEVGLRAYSAKDGKLRDREKAWSTIPMKARNDPAISSTLEGGAEAKKADERKPKDKNPDGFSTDISTILNSRRKCRQLILTKSNTFVCPEQRCLKFCGSFPFARDRADIPEGTFIDLNQIKKLIINVIQSKEAKERRRTSNN